MKRFGMAVAVAVATVAWTMNASATSIFVEGRITAVGKDNKTWTVQGYDHYNATKYGEKIGEVPVKVAADGIFVLDNRVVKPEVALAVGRTAFCIGSSAGSTITLVHTEPAGRQYGEVVSVAGNQVKLKVVMGKDALEETVTLDANAVFRGGTREALLAVGQTVRVAPARPATLVASRKAAAFSPTRSATSTSRSARPTGVPSRAAARSGRPPSPSTRPPCGWPPPGEPRTARPAPSAGPRPSGARAPSACSPSRSPRRAACT